MLRKLVLAAFTGLPFAFACSTGDFAGSTKRASADAKPAGPGSSSGSGSPSGSATTTPEAPAPDATPPVVTDPGSGSDTPGIDIETGSGQTSEPPANPSVENDALQYACKRGQAGLVGKVYRLAPGTAALPNLDALAPVGQINALGLNVPARSWSAGFPALPGLVEWFAIKFSGQFTATAGAYRFQTISDDGSKVYVDDQLVLNNDGTHSPLAKVSAGVTLEAGPHRITIEWFQGPRDQIALQLLWQPPGATAFAIIPAAALTHGTDCKLQTLGSFP